MLQFGGASGSGYLSQAEVQAGMQALKREGEFKDGVFRRRADVEGKRNMDGYQAIWEHVNGRPMVYPKPRYPQPIFMDPATYDWVPVEGAPGVCEKLLGVFTERRSEAGFFRLDAGASFAARGKGVYVVTRGAGTVGGQPLRALTTVYVDAGRNRHLHGAGGDRAPAFRPAQSRRPAHARRTSGPSKPRSRRQRHARETR